MGCQERSFLWWVLFFTFVLRGIYAFQAYSPALIPVLREVKEHSNTAHVRLASDVHPSRSPPAISPSRQVVKEPSSPTHSPLASDAQPLGHSPVISPAPHEVKKPSDIVPVPLANQHAPGYTPVKYPMPLEAEPPSIVPYAPMASHSPPSGFSPMVSPVPDEAKKPSDIARAPTASHLPPSISSPATSPPPQEVKESSNVTHDPLAVHLPPSGSSPAISPVPQEIKDPSNDTRLPTPSHLYPSGTSPTISPPPQELKDPSNITHAPLASHLHTSESSPATSPVPQEVKDPSTDTHAPMASHLHPSVSPPSQEAKDPTNITHAPSASHLHSSGFSPAISPVPQEVKEPSNDTHASPDSHFQSSGSSPATSPVPQEVKEPSNDTHAPSASHLHSSGSSPAISPVPQEVKDPSNDTHASPDSHFQSSGSSPATSPVPQEAKEPSNITHAPVASHLHPSVSSPTISPVPEELKHPSNDTHAPLAAHPKPSRSSPLVSPAPLQVNETHPYPLETSPVMSPLAHRVRNPSISTLAPSVSHSNQSGSVTLSPSSLPINSTPHLRVSSPVMSPAPHEVETPKVRHAPKASVLHPLVSPPAHRVRNPSISTLVPSASHSNQSGSVTLSPSSLPINSTPHLRVSSPVMIPAPHEGETSNVRHAPKASVLHPLVSPPVISPKRHEVNNASNNTHAPLASHPPHSSGIIILSPSSAPTVSIPRHSSSTITWNPVSAPLSPLPPASYDPGLAITPSPSLPTTFPQNKRSHHAPPPYIEVHSPSHPPEVSLYNNQRHHVPTPNVQVPFVSPIQPPFPPTDREKSYASSPSSVLPSPLYNWPSSPTIPPSGSFSKKKRAPLLQPMWAFPPPPPNLDCKSLTCLDPLTYPPPGSLCACVLPIKVGLRLGIALYTFFSLVSELAEEIASGIFMKQSQVRVMGANAATDDPEKTIALIYLVPLGRSFDISAALLVYERFFRKQILISASYFGDYDVLYVIYPGLPPSPPIAPTNYDGGGNGNAGAIRPLAVDPKKQKQRLSGSLVAIIVLLSVIALVLSIGAAWLLLLKYRGHSNLRTPTSQLLVPSFAKSSGVAPMISRPSSTSASFSSSLAAYTGSAKTFSLAEIERATDKFHDSRIIGEGGFGRVYNGTLDDGIMVAVKVLKRDDQQGGREFLAEVEMLSRLHHRNLVKLIGICTEENARCLVYELVPNGSLESHLHGPDKETTTLDWNARMKIALGAARGLAYLHEDSSPRVIHRDFKSSNILLEHDFTPKVSDFGLAKTAVDEGNQHILTRVMGTFGYVAPEYAMTGHLLVKSDVYSYGVVLLELLTGRKPVDMSQPPGEENLVAWARPLLTSTDGLQSMVDPALGTDISSDSITKVAAIASMCVQPEVSHRPFMGEVVQALKLVFGESDEHRRSGSGSHDESSTRDSEIIIGIRQNLEEERQLSESDIFCNSAQFSMDASGSFRRHSSSGPLQTGRSTTLWQRVTGFSSGSMNETGASRRLGNSGEQWP